jgi:hypothetical protein
MKIPKPKKELLENKTAIIISTIDELAIRLGEVISDYGMSVYISDVDFSEEFEIRSKKESTDKNKKEDFVLIYIR